MSEARTDTQSGNPERGTQGLRATIEWGRHEYVQAVRLRKDIQPRLDRRVQPSRARKALDQAVISASVRMERDVGELEGKIIPVRGHIAALELLDADGPKMIPASDTLDGEVTVEKAFWTGRIPGDVFSGSHQVLIYTHDGHGRRVSAWLGDHENTGVVWVDEDPLEPAAE